MSDAGDITISRLGAQGDGVADASGAPVFVPFALPGERWRLHDGRAPEQLTVSPERATPPCRHFGTCGGCIAQHMSDTTYAAWKRGIVVDAFAHRGITADVQPLRRIATGSRRRAYFGVARSAGDIAIGFREEGRHKLVNLSECVVLDPLIVSVMPQLRALADRILPKATDTGARVLVTALDNGLDVSFEASGKELSADTRQSLAAMSAAAGIVRLSI
jgi:23S rRNA (uracil1939-C5)-methyltransferase